MTKFIGFYRGEVVDVNDPRGDGRVKVRIFGAYDDLSVDVIPWADYADPWMGGSVDCGGYFVPDVKTIVWCFFEGGDFMTPVYFAGAPSGTHLPTERMDGETANTKRRVFKTKAGHLLIFDDTENASHITVHHSSGTKIELLDNGDIKETVTRNIERVVTGDVIETVQGNVTQTIEGNVEQLITGDMTQEIGGDYNRHADGEINDDASGNVNVTGTLINLN